MHGLTTPHDGYAPVISAVAAKASCEDEAIHKCMQHLADKGADLHAMEAARASRPLVHMLQRQGEACRVPVHALL